MKPILFLSIAFISVLASNCTIEKRVFQKGYHIEWNKKVQQSKTSDEITKTLVSTDHSETELPEEVLIHDENPENTSLITKQNEPEAVTFYTNTKSVDEPVKTSHAINSYQLASREKEIPNDQTTLKDRQDNTDENPNTPRKSEPVGIASFVFYLLGVGLGLGAIFAMNPIVFLGFTAFLLLTALILGIVSVVRFHRNRDLYQQNFFGYFGLIASASSLVLTIFILIIAVVLFLSGEPE
jgi:lysylphosphatidylglycerol synthetase-like protein (DUF2156 family)